MSRKPNKPAVARSLDSRSVSDRDAVAGASVCQSVPTVAVERTQPAPEARPKAIIVEAPQDPELAESPEELVRSVFALLVSRIGDRQARKVWAIVLKRRRGRPPNSIKYHIATVLPGIRRFERKMPDASVTQVITAFVEDIELAGIKIGASTEATVKRLVRDYKHLRKFGLFSVRPRKNNV